MKMENVIAVQKLKSALHLWVRVAALPRLQPRRLQTETAHFAIFDAQSRELILNNPA